jgi:hypothetical protein
VVIAILMEDSTSIRKTEEEKKEEEEVARAVNKTLAEEEKKRQEEEDEKKKRTEDETRGRKKDRGEKEIPKAREPEEERKDKGEALPCYNLTCPVVKPCQPCKEEEEPCPGQEPCEKCPDVEQCPDCPRCGQCPEVKPCDPCLPCPVANLTMGPPSTPGCPEPASMSVLEAMAVGAIASLLVTGVATAIGLLLRYTSPIFSGLLFIFIVVLTWYLSSRYPDVAREAGGRVVAVLREATVALGHRIMEAIRHHNDQVGLPVNSILL